MQFVLLWPWLQEKRPCWAVAAGRLDGIRGIDFILKGAYYRKRSFPPSVSDKSSGQPAPDNVCLVGEAFAVPHPDTTRINQGRFEFCVLNGMTQRSSV